MTFTAPDTIPQPPVQEPTNGKRPDPDAWRTIEAERLTDAEDELELDQHRLDDANAKVAAAQRALVKAQETLETAKANVKPIKAEVAFDEMKVASRKAGLATFDRLHAKAAK